MERKVSNQTNKNSHITMCTIQVMLISSIVHFDTCPGHPYDSALSNSFVIKSAILAKMQNKTLAKMPFHTQTGGNLI